MIKKIYKNRIIIWQATCLLCKYIFLHCILSDKNLLHYLSSKGISKTKYHYTKEYQTHQSISRSSKKILTFLYPNGNCLILSLVKRDLLAKHGFIEPIQLGLQNTDQGLKAHAWLSSENTQEYNLVHLLQ